MATWIWVLIPLAAIFAGVIKRWLDIKEKEMMAANRDAIARAEEYAAQTVRLEERVRVLERITVEKENSLERQIEALRDERAG
jgi:hypothetical protein